MDIEREVQEAIGLLSGKSYGTHNLSCDCVFCKAIDIAIAALQAYQPTISKTETTCCEWCDGKDHIIGYRDYTSLEITGNKLTAWGRGEAAVYINYCPNCGRRLEG